MHRSWSVLTGAWLCLVCVGAAIAFPPVTTLRAAASPQAGPPRDRPARATGTAVVRGVVLAADTSLPLRRARVELRLRIGGYFASVDTDSEGRFEFVAVPAGLLSVVASKSGYFSPGADPTTKPVIVEAREGQVVDPVVVHLPRGGAITGRITDELGEPVEGAFVEVMRRELGPEGRRLSMVGRTRGETDDTGAFRVWALPPGEYVVSAQPSRFVPLNDSRQAAGDGFAPTFYPGTANASDAQRVVVRSGRDTPGVVFALVPARLAAVRGRVLIPGGVSQDRVTVMVSRIEPERAGRSFSGVSVEPDGSFSAARLSPGNYTLTATLREPGGALDASRLRATADVRVDGVDVDGVVLTLRPGATLTGRIVTDDGAPLPGGGTTVSLAPRRRDGAFSGPVPSGRADADGTFRLSGIFGEMQIQAFVSAPAANAGGTGASPPRVPWGVKAVYVNGRDVTDEPLNFDRGDIDAEIVLTTRLSHVTGSVSGPNSATGQRPTVLVFAASPEAWVVPARRVRQVTVGADGRFSVRGLPPGDRYLAVAVEGAQTPTSWSPDLLMALRDSATSLRIDEGGVHELTLRVVPRPPLVP